MNKTNNGDHVTVAVTESGREMYFTGDKSPVAAWGQPVRLIVTTFTDVEFDAWWPFSHGVAPLRWRVPLGITAHDMALVLAAASRIRQYPV